jgi:hypothetical protein
MLAVKRNFAGLIFKDMKRFFEMHVSFLDNHPA